MDHFKKYKVELLSGGTWFTSTTFQVVEKKFTRGKDPREIDSNQIFKGSLLECEAYLRLIKSGFIY